ncbi:CPBP family intramembrane glutamic endopeptidase [Dactylosporangium sp. AC04546]|uniref:CPBP family intramembrane glutamic endopeptidase n=1 Tax=Dactylosporangium sp. AC04546 TaxID=2862460 RepID=UPI001EDEC983|nr:CPBP family intramembrane glutamic endopeptidase [Dactylosporangium sp. AC04546]WVK84672.1 CPBP family intramembrane glutamic endopeptidase [Dactylosporangium sp. AC04546]
MTALVRPPIRHALTVYFTLAFALTWLAWLPYVLSETGLGVLPIRIPEVLGSTQTLGLLPGAYLGPITAAFVVTALTEGRSGLRRWARRLVRWRVGAWWYVAIVVAVPAVAVVATLPLPGAWADARLPTVMVLAAYLPVLLMQVVTSGLAEEPGWRDFAQPRLQDRFGPLAGSLILGPLWGAWHLPLFFSDWAGWPDVRWSMAVEFVVSSVFLSIVLTWVFNRTGQSLPAAMLLHANVNTVFSLAWPAMFPSLDAFSDSLHALTIGAGATAAVLVVGTRGRLGYRGSGPNATGEAEAEEAEAEEAARDATAGGAAIVQGSRSRS